MNRSRDKTMKLALITDVFFSADGERRLRARLAEARAAGAELAVLPELALDPWFLGRRRARAEDAELPHGRRSRVLSAAARSIGIGVVGGAVVRDRNAGHRRNTALVFDAGGRLIASYAKCHLPSEPGFWEATHYEPGLRPAVPIESFAVPVGIQLCSDVNRPAGSQALAALGAELIVVPRATEAATYDRWRLVLRANAITAAVYVASVNRPPGQPGPAIGGPSVVIGPDGSVLLETEDPVATVIIERGAVAAARSGYPGSLAVRADLYARAWAKAR
jgi:predicted amidohydrolase